MIFQKKNSHRLQWESELFVVTSFAYDFVYILFLKMSHSNLNSVRLVYKFLVLQNLFLDREI